MTWTLAYSIAINNIIITITVITIIIIIIIIILVIIIMIILFQKLLVYIGYYHIVFMFRLSPCSGDLVRQEWCSDGSLGFVAWGSNE